MYLIINKVDIINKWKYNHISKHMKKKLGALYFFDFAPWKMLIQQGLNIKGNNYDSNLNFLNFLTQLFHIKIISTFCAGLPVSCFYNKTIQTNFFSQQCSLKQNNTYKENIVLTTCKSDAGRKNDKIRGIPVMNSTYNE